MHHSKSTLRTARKTNPKARRCQASLNCFEVHVTHRVSGPSGHVTPRAPSRRESRQALCARLRRCLPSSRREGEERRSDQASGARCACAANSCHPVRNKSSKFPKSPWAGGHPLPPHLPPLGSIPVHPARQVTAFPDSGRGMVGGGARAVFSALPRSARSRWGCRRSGQRRRGARDAGSTTAADVLLGREWPAIVAAERGGSQ